MRDDSVAGPRLTTWLIGLFAGLALIITASGITGVVALAVTQRTSEIGIRMALGATRVRVLAMVMRQGMALVVIGVVAGIAGALAINRLVASLLFETPANDPLTFVAVSIMLLVVAAVACLVPALRAVSINPLSALRSE